MPQRIPAVTETPQHALLLYTQGVSEDSGVCTRTAVPALCRPMPNSCHLFLPPAQFLHIYIQCEHTCSFALSVGSFVQCQLGLQPSQHPHHPQRK
ncbi:hypothetical protein SKAU_G00304470 [Synaphobranchus kaupii]|uniref:Uncharacterized protein n=1 Tax=Synaphobranchus kaupii TaxID=118154 RepID=A0A9Q1EWB0_SYNKA|nr:hypothetical protein SKAU_G00304470 [Synaphobranchus kaupii]